MCRTLKQNRSAVSLNFVGKRKSFEIKIHNLTFDTTDIGD